MQNCPCPTCMGKFKARYTVGPVGPYLDPEKGQEMTCRTCWGSGKEPVAPELRGRMFAELAQYISPKRKAVEHTAGEGLRPFVMIGVAEDTSAEEWERRNNPDLDPRTEH